MSLSGEENLSKKLFGNGVLGFLGYHIQLWIMCIDILETKNNTSKTHIRNGIYKIYGIAWV